MPSSGLRSFRELYHQTLGTVDLPQGAHLMSYGASYSCVLSPRRKRNAQWPAGPGQQHSSLASLETTQLAWWRLSNPDDTSLGYILVASSCYRTDFSGAGDRVRMRAVSSHSLWSLQSVPPADLSACSSNQT